MNPSFLAPTVGNSTPELGATFSISSATNVFLPPSALGLQSITMTALGQSVFLPPVYSIVPGETKFSIKNNGTYPFGVRDSLGNLLTSITGSGSAIFALDNTTNWSFTGTNLEPGLVTIDNTFGATFIATSAALPQFVALDNNTSIHFAALSSGFAAFVVDNLAKVVNTAVTVDATAGTTPATVFKVSNTSALLITSSGGGAFKAFVLTLTGTSPTYSISVGASANLALAPFTADADNFVGPPKWAQLSPTSYIGSAAFGGANPTSVIALSVAGAVVTAGAVTNIIATSSVTASTTTYALTGTTALVLYKSGGAAPFANNGVVITVAGTVCTVGTPAALTGVASSLTAVSSNCLLSPTKCLVQDDNNTAGSVITSVFTIAATTVTAGTLVSVETGITTSSSYTANAANRYNPHLFPLGTNTSGLWYLDSSGVSRVVVLTESAGVVTAGGLLYRSISGQAANGTESGVILPQGTSEFVSAKLDGVTSSFKIRAVAHKISGATITVGATRYLDGPGLNINNTSATFTRMSSGDYVHTGNGFNSSPGAGGSGSSAALPVFRSNGDAINPRGQIAVTALSNVSLATTAVSSNRIVILGFTYNDATTIAAGTYQVRLLNVEIAQ